MPDRTQRGMYGSSPLGGLVDLGLGDYRNTGDFWHLNTAFPGLTCVHREPFIFVVPDFFSGEWCDRLMATAWGHLARSEVPGDVGPVISDRRTSYESRIPEAHTVEQHGRVSELVNLPPAHFEPLKVTRYRSGEFFKAHTDSKTRSRPLAATLVIYLNDCPRGGETAFTKLGIS
eukprot:2182129-Prymnesium_polylepis.1